LISAARSAYDDRVMTLVPAFLQSFPRVRSLLLGPLLAALALGLGACDSGGLLLVNSNTNVQPAEPQPAQSTMDFVSGGTVATNAKYKVVYTLGQPTPNQNVETDPTHQLNGGLVGSMAQTAPPPQ
jgi:hypothetical protein